MKTFPVESSKKSQKPLKAELDERCYALNFFARLDIVSDNELR